MAGTVVDADGRVLSFVVQSPTGLPGGVGTLSARAALDRFVAALATCGCPLTYREGMTVPDAASAAGHPLRRLGVRQGHRAPARARPDPR